VGALAVEARGLLVGALVWGMFFWALGTDGFVGAFGLTMAELEPPEALERGGCGGGRLAREETSVHFDAVDEHCVDGAFVSFQYPDKWVGSFSWR
jgi:hypothetical protein